MIRTFKCAASFDREHEWKKKPAVKTMSEGERKAAWSKRQRELSVNREKDAKLIKARHAARKEAHEDRVNEVRRHAAIDKHNMQSRHRQEINTRWRKQAPRPEMHLRPPASFTRPMPTLGGEMGRALKGLIHSTQHSTTVVAERRTMEQNKNLARSTFVRALVSTSPLEKPSPAPQPRSVIHGQFRDRGEDSQENRLRHLGITDRQEGVQTIKRWQRAEIEDIDRRTRQSVDQLREEYDSQVKQNERDWADHKEKHDRLREDARKEHGVAEKTHERADAREAAAMDVGSYVDDYISGKGRDSAEHEQFASNYGPEIEKEFQRRAAEMSSSPQPENQAQKTEQSRDETPAFEPDDYVPEHYADFDREIGD